jgi:uncharacterized protein (TIGR03437 family)
MRSSLTIVQRLLILGAGVLPSAFGYIPYTITTTGANPQTIQINRADSANLQIYLNNQVVAGAQSSLSGTVLPVITASSNPAGAVEAAMDNWNSAANAAGASVNYLALQSTASVHNSTDCVNVISMAGSAADLSVLGFVSPSSFGAVAITANAYITGAGTVCGGTTSVPAGTIIDSDVLLNPYIAFSTDNTANTVDLQGTITHELGHLIGMNHSELLGTTMYPFTSYNVKEWRRITTDEKAYATAAYPVASGTTATISGTITLSSNPVAFGLVTLMDQTKGRTFQTMTNATGAYSTQVPAGSYIVYAEPLNSYVGPQNIYSTTTGSINPAQVTTGYEPTFFGSTSAPTVVTATTGATATANIAVTGGTSTLTAPTYGFGAAGGSGDISAVHSLTEGATVVSGQSLDIGFSGGGVSPLTNILVFGTGISVTPGTTKVDSAGVLRATLVIPAQTNATLDSIWLVSGTSTIAFSGGLVVEPVTPVINNVEDAESARTSFTSGQWAAIYGNNLAGTTRTWNPSLDFTGGVTAGSPLPASLDGVTVTVNSVPAAVYFVCGTCSPTQINFLTPSGLATGPATVVVSNNGSASAAFSSTIVQASPSFFYYGAGSSLYPLAVHLSDGKIVGDPTALSGTEVAHPGETLEMFMNGIAPATGEVIVSSTAFTQQVSITAGTTALGTSAPYLVSAGEFQVNVTIPSGLAAGNYPLTMTVPNGSTTTSGVTIILPVGP